MPSPESFQDFQELRGQPSCRELPPGAHTLLGKSAYRDRERGIKSQPFVPNTGHSDKFFSGQAEPGTGLLAVLLPLSVLYLLSTSHID